MLKFSLLTFQQEDKAIAKPQVVRAYDLKKLLKEMEDYMQEKRYRELDRLLDLHPQVVRHAQGRCEEPLIRAVKFWDPTLVSICMKHGSSASAHHYCKEVNRKINAILMANDLFLEKAKMYNTTNDGYDRLFAQYQAILHELVCYHPFPTRKK